jgi:hypothetical protein
VYEFILRGRHADAGAARHNDHAGKHDIVKNIHFVLVTSNKSRIPSKSTTENVSTG